MVEVFRAINGKHYVENGSQYFEGVSEEDILYARRISYDSMSRRVDGLPIYLNPDEALGRLREKRFRHAKKGLAVLAIAHIDEALITSGRVKIIRNVGDSSGFLDEVLTAQQLAEHREDRNKIRGECYMRGLSTRDLLPLSDIYIAAAYRLNGEVDFSIKIPLVGYASLGT
jgi:hypothetical protein